MRTTLLLAGLVLVAGPLAAHDDKKYESRAGKYAVEFPGKPMVETKKTDEGELNIASVAEKGGGFMVIYTDLPADKLKDTKPKDLLASGEKGLVDGFKAKINSSKDIEFGKDKYPARQLTATAFIPDEAVTINLRLTIILANNRLYQVFVFGPKELPTSPEANKFFDSFEITK
jgi:hypothetical protein